MDFQFPKMDNAREFWLNGFETGRLQSSPPGKALVRCSGRARCSRTCRAKKLQKLWENDKIDFFTKIIFLTILNGIWEVWGCPGAWHGAYEAIPSNFGGIWSYIAWGKSIFMFLGNIGNSLHHQIPPNCSSGLQIGPRILLEARAPSQENKTN